MKQVKARPLAGAVYSKRVKPMGLKVNAHHEVLKEQTNISASDPPKRPPLKRPPLFLQRKIKVEPAKLQVLRAGELQFHSLNGQTKNAAPPTEMEMVSLKCDLIRPVSVKCDLIRPVSAEIKETVVTIESEGEKPTISKPTENVAVMMPEADSAESTSKPNDPDVFDFSLFSDHIKRYLEARREQIEEFAGESSSGEQEGVNFSSEMALLDSYLNQDGLLEVFKVMFSVVFWGRNCEPN